jgi:hypothetical protein
MMMVSAVQCAKLEVAEMKADRFTLGGREVCRRSEEHTASGGVISRGDATHTTSRGGVGAWQMADELAVAYGHHAVVGDFTWWMLAWLQGGRIPPLFKEDVLMLQCLGVVYKPLQKVT